MNFLVRVQCLATYSTYVYMCNDVISITFVCVCVCCVCVCVCVCVFVYGIRVYVCVHVCMCVCKFCFFVHVGEIISHFCVILLISLLEYYFTLKYCVIKSGLLLCFFVPLSSRFHRQRYCRLTGKFCVQSVHLASHVYRHTP